MESESIGEALDRLREIVHGNDDMIDPGGDGVDRGIDRTRGLVLGGRFVRCVVGATAGDFDAMGLGEYGPHDLFDEIRIDSIVDGPLAASGDDIAHPLGLNDGSVGGLFQASHLVTHFEPLCQNIDQLSVQFVDSLSQRTEVG